MNEIKHSLKQFYEVFKSKDKKIIILLVKEIIIYGLILCFLKVPFVLCRDIVVDYFYKISNGSVLGLFFYWLFEILYVLFIILLIKNWLLKRFSTNDK